MVKGVEKGYILEIENFVKFNVHSSLKTLLHRRKYCATRCCSKQAAHKNDIKNAVLKHYYTDGNTALLDVAASKLHIKMI